MSVSLKINLQNRTQIFILKTKQSASVVHQYIFKFLYFEKLNLSKSMKF